MTDKDPSPEVQAYAPRRERIPAPFAPPTASTWDTRELSKVTNHVAQVDKSNELARATADALVKMDVQSVKWEEPKPPILAIAIKNDDGKPGFELLPMDALGSINDVLRFGAKKYAPHNWEKGFAWTRLGNAILRHVFAWLSGETLDRETGLPHLAHAGCMLLFALSHQLRGIGTNDIEPSQTATRPE